MQERDVAPLWARMGVLEDAVLEVVGDERRDPFFKLLAALVAMIAALQRRILREERWNRRLARKRYMLGGEAMRMNMCDRLGGVGALERWEARARARLAGAGLAGGGDSQEGGPTSSAGTWEEGVWKKKREVPGKEVAREFALPRLPSAGVRRRRRGGVRSPARHETPIAVWPCEVMPERFRREWWRRPRLGQDTRRHTFPERRAAAYPGPPTGEPIADTADVGGPGLNPGTCERETGRRGSDTPHFLACAT